MTAPITFSFQLAFEGDARRFSSLARRAEALGYAAVYVADHPGISVDPFVALAAVAGVTSRVRVGTYVVNTGVRDPLALASAAATVDALSYGRLTLGLGAGHTPQEWTMLGVDQPSASARVGRLVEMVDVVERLLDGATVTYEGTWVRTKDARLETPRPAQPRVPLLIGGNGRRVLRLAGERASIVGMSGLGRTLPDGHRHLAEWSESAIDERVQLVHQAAAGRLDAPVLDALVQHFEITDRPREVAEQVAAHIEGVTPQDVLAAPYVLIGSVDQLADEVVAHRERWGFTSYVVRGKALDAAARLIERLG